MARLSSIRSGALWPHAECVHPSPPAQGRIAKGEPLIDCSRIDAYLELHIEQGPVLEAEEFPIGIAEEVSGVCYLELELTGIANHSGTTPMHLRADAFAGLSELAGTIPDLIQMHGTDQSRFTIGHVFFTRTLMHLKTAHFLLLNYFPFKRVRSLMGLLSFER